jgi:hypothetical protein
MELNPESMQKTWDDYLKDQHATCDRYNVDWVYADIELKIGIADNVLTDVIPINGMRHQVEKGTTGWYIWSGENFSMNSDFFKPFCVKHLIELKPEIIKYLGLPPGYRFLVDNIGFEDIWEDKKLLKNDF